MKTTAARKIGDFEVCSLGVNYPDYFQGFGTAFTKYSYCAYGIGDTEEEAFADCLEMAAQQGFDLDDDTEKRIRDEAGPFDDCTSAAEDCGEDCDEYPYYHVGIRWNDRAESRLERIRHIPNLEFLSYESYQPQGRDGRYGLQTWAYIYRADGDVSYGDLKPADCPDDADKYLSALPAEDTEPGEIYFYVPCASGSDYSGSTVERSNYKVFTETYGDKDFVFSAYGGHGTYAAVVGLTGLLGCDDDTFEEICNALEGLEDYPCIDDEALSELEMESADEAWDSWASGDFVRAVERKFEDEAELELPSGDALRTLFEDKRESANVYWYNEGYGHDMYVDVDRVVDEITFDDVEDYAVEYRVEHCECGIRYDYYYIESEAIDAWKRSAPTDSLKQAIRSARRRNPVNSAQSAQSTTRRHKRLVVFLCAKISRAIGRASSRRLPARLHVQPQASRPAAGFTSSVQPQASRPAAGFQPPTSSASRPAAGFTSRAIGRRLHVRRRPQAVPRRSRPAAGFEASRPAAGFQPPTSGFTSSRRLHVPSDRPQASGQPQASRPERSAAGSSSRRRPERSMQSSQSEHPYLV